MSDRSMQSYLNSAASRSEGHVPSKDANDDVVDRMWVGPGLCITALGGPIVALQLVEEHGVRHAVVEIRLVHKESRGKLVQDAANGSDVVWVAEGQLPPMTISRWC